MRGMTLELVAGAAAKIVEVPSLAAPAPRAPQREETVTFRSSAAEKDAHAQSCKQSPLGMPAARTFSDLFAFAIPYNAQTVNAEVWMPPQIGKAPLPPQDTPKQFRVGSVVVTTYAMVHDSQERGNTRRRAALAVEASLPLLMYLEGEMGCYGDDFIHFEFIIHSENKALVTAGYSNKCGAAGLPI